MKFNQTLYQSLKDTSINYPDRDALLFMDKYIDYESLVSKVDSLAKGFFDLGIKKDDTVTIAMPNVFEAIFAFYALNKLGVRLHLVHPLTPVKQMQKHMKFTESKTLIILDTFFDHYKDILDDNTTKFILCKPVTEFGFIKHLGYNIINRKKLRNVKYSERILKLADLYKDGDVEVEKINPKQTAFLLHSGGTSGTPKTIELSNYAVNFLATSGPYILNSDDFEDKHMLSVLPMFHGFGLCMGIHQMMMVGGVNTLMPKFNSDEVVKLIENNQVNYLIGVPSLYEALLRHKEFKSKNIKNIEQAFVGGDYVAEDLKQRFDAVMKYYYADARMYEGYGLTEVVTVCSVNTSKEYKSGSVGRPLPGIEMAILDLEDQTKILEPNNDGEIIVSGKTMMNGYLKDKEATENTIIKLNDKLWIKTGDLGYMDEEGYVFFKQRLKRIIKVNGIPVLPSEIENFLMDLENVKEVAAIAKPDTMRGNIVKLFITYNKGKTPLAEDKIKELIKTNISPYAVPSQVVVMEELPKTIIGKTNVLELEKME